MHFLPAVLMVRASLVERQVLSSPSALAGFEKVLPRDGNHQDSRKEGLPASINEPPPVEKAVTGGFNQMGGKDGRFTGQVGDRTGNLQDAGVGAG